MLALPAKVRKISNLVTRAGGRAFLVGGSVRDHLLGFVPKDFDIEVYGLQAELLESLLDHVGTVHSVGQSFQVYKIDQDIDVSLPRRDVKTGRGHRGFTATADPFMSFEAATKRRDFTMNAMMLDLESRELIDLHGGQKDLRDKIIRLVDPQRFSEDSLRVLRAAQFASRLKFTIDPATVAYCKKIDLDDLPPARIWTELENILLGSESPSLGFAYLYELEVVRKLFPELQALVGVPQEPEWHPEGDVDVHTLMVLDEARKLIDDLDRPKKIVVMLAALCHDFGKPSTTEERDGRIRSIGHEEAGVNPTLSFLNRLGIFTIDGYDVRDQIVSIVREHLKPGQFYREKDRVSDGALRRLARLVETDLLCRVAAADSLGRRPDWLPEERWPNDDAQKWFRTRIKELNIEESAPKPLLLGRHLIGLGATPSPRFSKILELVYQAQLDGSAVNLEDCLSLAKKELEKS